MDIDSEIKTVILAAGKGTRMKSSVPKVLHRIMGKALLERVLDQVFLLDNISEAFVIVGHQADIVSSFVSDTYKNQKIKSVLQEPQLGTGDAVNKVYNDLNGFKGTVLVLCGDTPLLTSQTLSKFIECHQKSGASVTVLSAIVDCPTNYGRIARNENNFVEKIVEEKDATNKEKEIKEINAGVYCIDWDKTSQAFCEMTSNNAQGEYYLTDIIEWSVKKGLKVDAYVLEDNNEIFGINSKTDLATATSILNNKNLKNLMQEGVTIISPDNTFISPETQIESDTVIYPGCVIEGENFIGKNCIIGPNTYIGGNVKTSDNVKIIQSNVSNVVILENSSIGPFAHIRDNVEINSNVRIGNFVEVKNSKIKKNTNVSHLSYIGDAQLGENVNIGAGTITANYDPLSKKKSLTEIENNVKIGSNSVLIAPVKIKDSANVAAGSIITKDVQENALAIARSKQLVIENWVKKRLNELSKR